MFLGSGKLCHFSPTAVAKSASLNNIIQRQDVFALKTRQKTLIYIPGHGKEKRSKCKKLDFPAFFNYHLLYRRNMNFMKQLLLNMRLQILFAYPFLWQRNGERRII